MFIMDDIIGSILIRATVPLPDLIAPLKSLPSTLSVMHPWTDYGAIGTGADPDIVDG